MKETSSELQSPPFVPGPLPLLTCLFWMEQSCWCCSVQPGSNKHQSLSANFCGNLTLNTPGAPCPTPALHPEILYCSASRTKLFFSQQGSSDASPYPTRPAKCLDEESTKELPPHPPRLRAALSAPVGDDHRPPGNSASASTDFCQAKALGRTAVTQTRETPRRGERGGREGARGPGSVWRGGGGGGSHLRSRRLLQDDGAGQELGELVVVVGVIDPLQGNAPAGRQAAAPAAHPHHQRAGWRPTSPFAHPAHPSINPIYRLALPAHLSPHLMRRHPSGRTLVRRQKNHREIVVRQPALHAAAAPPDGTAPPSSPHLSLATLLPLRRDATAGDWRLAARSLAIGGWRRAAPGLNVGGAAAIVTVSSGSRWVPLSPGAAPRLLHPPPPHPIPFLPPRVSSGTDAAGFVVAALPPSPGGAWSTGGSGP